MYEDLPPSPTEEYMNATIKKRIARIYGDEIIISIVL
jgi:hypothetical protein